MRLSSLAAVSLAVAVSNAGALTLYDPAGGLPSAQGWTTLVFGAGANESVSAGTYKLNTTGAGVVLWGNSQISATPLNTGSGFDLSFSLKIDSETHSSVNRAGYSVVVVGADPTKALELSFWATNIWAQDYDASQPDRFVHGPDVRFNTTAALTTYTLAVRNQQFTLSASSAVLLSGSFRDYTLGGAPYTTPNFLFFGDNSSRGTATSQMGFVTLTAVPEPASLLLFAAGATVLAWRRRRFRA